MGTVSKAMTLLEAFSVVSPEIGLTELARAVAFDKATTLRLLRSLAAHGMVEKVELTKRYRLGPAVLRLARIREADFPFMESARPVLEGLSRNTGESCHITEASPNFMTSVLVVESGKAIRVTLTPGQHIPFHCTASGVAYLAFGPAGIVERILKKPLERLTPRTITKAVDLRKAVEATRKRGFSINRGEFDAETVSVAAPIMDEKGIAFGAVSVAAPASRTDEPSLLKHGAAVMRAARDITKALGGKTAADEEPGTKLRRKA